MNVHTQTPVSTVINILCSFCIYSPHTLFPQLMTSLEYFKANPTNTVYLKTYIFNIIYFYILYIYILCIINIIYFITYIFLQLYIFFFTVKDSLKIMTTIP